MKAMSGLFRVLNESEQSPSVPILFLLSEARTLVRSTKLVFNDAPSFYERAGALPDLHSMARVQECGDLRPYLLSIISCQSEDDITLKLNKLNVREHHPTTASRRSGMVPLPGDQVSDAHQKLFKAGDEDFTVGEYVGYRPDDSPHVLYSIIKERLISSSSEVTYVVHTGDNKTVVAAASQLYKFVRN